MARSWSARTATARSGGSRTAASEYIGDQADAERPARHVKAGDQHLGLGTISSSARARGRLRFASAPWFPSQGVAAVRHAASTAISTVHHLPDSDLRPIIRVRNRRGGHFRPGYHMREHPLSDPFRSADRRADRILFVFLRGGRIYTQRYRFRSADIAPNRGRSWADLTAQLEDAPR